MIVFLKYYSTCRSGLLHKIAVVFVVELDCSRIMIQETLSLPSSLWQSSVHQKAKIRLYFRSRHAFNYFVWLKVSRFRNVYPVTRSGRSRFLFFSSIKFTFTSTPFSRGTKTQLYNWGSEKLHYRPSICRPLSPWSHAPCHPLSSITPLFL